MKGIRLYPDIAPGSENVDLTEEYFEEPCIDGSKKCVVQKTKEPVLLPFYAAKPNGIAMLVIPGGGYCREIVNNEGTDVATWLNSIGINAFVLVSRLPFDPHDHAKDVALMDAQRAVKLMRANCNEYGIEKDQIGVIGFSAGGHMAASLATCYDKQLYEPIDHIDHESARPDFCALGYPAICIEEELRALINRNTNIENPKIIRRLAVLSKYSCDELVTKEVPPEFIFDTDDDRVTRAEHSIRFYLACRKAGVSAELHIFRKGGHGFGLGKEEDEAHQWKQLFINWLKSMGRFEE